MTDLSQLAKSHDGCTCMCHKGADIRHFFPCCGAGAITPEWIKKMADLEGDTPISAGSPNHPLRAHLKGQSDADA